MNSPDYQLSPIGLIHSCYPEKFGIPRQPGLVDAACATLEFIPPYNREEMVKGLQEYSHLWILFVFHQTLSAGWKATVRPPRLGGQTRVGVFSSRSPHRPNHLGMSVVRLEQIVVEAGAVSLELSGVDLLDKTPVIDLKPYVPYADSIPTATEGFTAIPMGEMRVEFLPDAAEFCRKYQQQHNRNLHQLITQTLRQDPRPASQRVAGREFGMLLWDVNVRFCAENDSFTVLRCTSEG